MQQFGEMLVSRERQHTELDALRPRPSGAIPVTFNDPDGVVALRAIDLVRTEDGVGFFHRDVLRSPRERIKQSSRLVTYISLPTVSKEWIADVLITANVLLTELREHSADLFRPSKATVMMGVVAVDWITRQHVRCSSGLR